MTDNIVARDGNGLTLNFRTTEISPGLHIPQQRIADGLTVAGAAQSALTTDLLTGLPFGWFDASSFFSASIQIIGSAGITAGGIIFEQTNDPSSTTGLSLPAFEASVLNSNPIIAATTIAANSRRMWLVPVTARYIRARISTAFANGTVQAIANFSQQPFANPVLNVQQAVAGSLLSTVTPTTPTQHSLNSAASINAALVKSGVTTIYGLVMTNLSAAPIFVKFYQKTTAPNPTTDTPVMVFRVAANSTLDVSLGTLGARFATGVAYVATTGVADNDTGAIGAGDLRMIVNYV